MIFDESDRISYFSDLNATSERLDAAIRQAVILAESPDGAARKLEVAEYIEIRSLPSIGRFYLTHRPIIEGSAAVYVRGGHLGSLYGSFPVLSNEWTILEDGYSLDLGTGEVTFQTIFEPNFSSISLGWGRGGSSRPTRRYQSPQVKVVYESGFDFLSPSSNASKIKDVLAELVRVLLQNQAASTGVESYVLEGFYEASYNSDSTTSLIKTYLNTIRLLTN